MEETLSECVRRGFALVLNKWTLLFTEPFLRGYLLVLYIAEDVDGEIKTNHLHALIHVLFAWKGNARWLQKVHSFETFNCILLI